MPNYLQQLRQLIGSRKVIHPAARIIVENEKGEILMIRRKDNGNWGVPAGGLEENETIAACMVREVKEETGLDILSMQVIGIITNPKRETVSYPNGDVVQYFTIEFYSNDWQGDIGMLDTDEIKYAQFVDRSYIAKLPDNERPIFESLAHFRETGQPLLD